MVLTTLDMSLFFGTSEQQNEFSLALLQTLKSRGVAKIKNHSIPEAEITRLFEMVSLTLAFAMEKLHADYKYRLDNSLYSLMRRRCTLNILLSRHQTEDTATSVKKVSQASVASTKVYPAQHQSVT